MKIRTKILILSIIGVVLVIFAIGWYLGQRKGNNASQEEIANYNQQITVYKAKIKEDSVTVYQVSQIVMSQKEALRELELKNKDLRALDIKRVNEITQLKGDVKILLQNVSHTGIIVHVDTVLVNGEQRNALLLPFTFADKNEWYDISGGFNTLGKMNIGLNVFLDLSVYTGYRKGDKTPFCVVTTPNPNIQINSITSLKVEVPKEKKWGIGVVVGYGVLLGNPMQSAPFIGIGISRNIIRF